MFKNLIAFFVSLLRKTAPPAPPPPPKQPKTIPKAHIVVTRSGVVAVSEQNIFSTHEEQATEQEAKEQEAWYQRNGAS